MMRHFLLKFGQFDKFGVHVLWCHLVGLSSLYDVGNMYNITMKLQYASMYVWVLCIYSM